MEQDYEEFSAPTRCDVCTSSRVRLTTNREVHGAKAHNPDVRLYHCFNPKCGASAPCIGDTDKPAGLMCSPYIYGLRVRAHLQFDPLWQLGKMSRSKAYKLLREELKLAEGDCHIGKMSEEQLNQVIAFAKGCLNAEAAIQKRRQEKKYERQQKRNERRNSIESYKRGAKRYS